MTNLLPNLFTIARRSGFCGCHNCCCGFGCPHICHHCCGGCCGCGCCGDSMTFPVTFGACVNNPCCECCKKPPKKGFCQWPCMWPCCCECKVPEFKLKPLKPKAVPKECNECCHSCCHGCCHCCHCCRKRGGKVFANNKQPWSERIFIFLLFELIISLHYNSRHRALSKGPFYTGLDKFCTNKNLRGSTLGLQETGRTGLIFERLSVQVCYLLFSGTKFAHLAIEKFAQFRQSRVNARWNRASFC